MDAISTLLVVCVVLLVVILLAIIAGVAMYMRRLDEATRQLTTTLASVEKSIGPVATEAQKTLVSVDELAQDTRKLVVRVNGIAGDVEEIAREAKTLTHAADAVYSGSKSTVVSVIQGLRQAWKVFKKSDKGTEDQKDEKQS